MARVYNFSAGPSVLPEVVLKEAAEEMLDYKGTGMSVMEMSHRSKAFDNIIKEAEKDLRDLMNIPDNYKVLFLQGGASQQFAAIPMNLMKNGVADYIITGQWAKKAYEEAKKYGKAVAVASSADKTFSYIPDCSDLPIDDDADYVYICHNNTIYGTTYHTLPNTKLNLNYSDDENPLSLKSDFILSLCELIVGGKEGLQPVEKTIIDRCVRMVYRDYLADPVPENMPILEDLYNALLTQEEKEAQYIATALEIYVHGSLNVFNHRTSINIENRIVSFDIKELGKQLKKIGMLIVQDAVWNRVTINREAHKSTRYYIDEMHLLLREEQTAAYTVEIWKRFRKWGGIPTGITQNVKDLLSSREVENIFENSDFILMLNQASGDRQILAKQLNISPHQLSYVTHSGEGEGLLFYGNIILPFVDRFPKDTELYRVMTAKPNEVSGA